MRRPRSLRALTLSSNATIGPTTAQGPPSPTFTATTNVSHLDMRLGLPPGKVITRADLRASMAAYEELLNSSARYRSALTQMAKASAEFAKAIENTSRLKGGSDESCVGLQAAAGLHHLMANHWEVLGSSIVNQVEKPLHVELDTYKQVVHERSVAYEKSLQERSKIIRQTEMENMATGRKKQRDLNSFRAALNVLQSQVDELDRLKEAHYKEIIEHEEEVWTVVLGKVAVLVRSSLDVFDRLAAKQTDPMLEPMVQAHPDPFDSYGPPKPEDQIFSILPPLAIMSGSTGSLSARSATSPILTTPDLIPTSSSLPQSWADAAPSPFGSFSGSESWGGGGGGGGGNDFKTPSSPTRERPSSPKSPGSATLTFRHARRSLPNTSVSPTTSTAMAQSSSSNISPPSSMRRSESKLRSVLASVDELPTTEVSNSALSTQHQQHRHHMRSEAASSSTVTSADSDRTALWSAEQAGYTFKEGPASEDEDNGVGGEGDRGTIRHALRPSSSQTTPRSSVFRIPVARPTSPLKNGVSDGEDPGPGPQSLPNM